MGIYTVLAIVMAYSAYQFGKRIGNKRFVWIKLLLTVLLFIIVLFVTKKYYEVPVHVNTIEYENMVNSDILGGCFDVNITYDYNNSPDMRKSPNFKEEECGLFIYSFFVLKPNHNKLFFKGYHKNDSILNLRVMADNTLHFIKNDDFNLDSVEHAFRGEIWTSNRQFLYPIIFSDNQIIRQIRLDTILIPQVVVDEKGQKIKDSIERRPIGRSMYLSDLKHSGRQHNGCLREEYQLLENNNNILSTNDHHLRLDYRYPNTVFSGEDISSAIEYFSLSLIGIPDTLFHSLKFEYFAPIDIDGLPFEADTTTMTSIVFNSPPKLAYIAKNGLTFHVSFPDMKNSQAVRTIIATGVLGLLIGLMFSLLGSIMRGNIAALFKTRSWKEFLTMISSMLKNIVTQPYHSICYLFHKENNGYLYFCNYIRNHPFSISFLLLIVIIIILFLIIVDFSNVNPFDPEQGANWNIININKYIYS